MSYRPNKSLPKDFGYKRISVTLTRLNYRLVMQFYDDKSPSVAINDILNEFRRSCSMVDSSDIDHKGK